MDTEALPFTNCSKTVSGPYVGSITLMNTMPIFMTLGKVSYSGHGRQLPARKALCSVFATGSNFSASNGGFCLDWHMEDLGATAGSQQRH